VQLTHNEIEHLLLERQQVFDKHGRQQIQMLHVMQFVMVEIIGIQ
jgi:hypothetical protein